MLGLGAALLAPLAGCMTKPLRHLEHVRADGTYCHRIGRTWRAKLTCTPTAVPTDAAEAEAKRFEADPASMTVYVLRRRWGDASVVVPVSVDGAMAASTVPGSLVRLRLKPGSHSVSTVWEGQVLDISVIGRAGDLRLLELVGSAWAWGTNFSWEAPGVDEVRLRAIASKLVADLDLRH
jgi:hypothetical protein